MADPEQTAPTSAPGSADAGLRIGVDVGGTFTDVVSVHEGSIAIEKTPSTPDAVHNAVLSGADAAASANAVSLADCSLFGHGTTVATNAVLEGDWANTALLTTEGFRDVLEIGRQDRPGIYDLQAEKPRPVVEREQRYEIPERLDERGEVLEALEEQRVRDLGHQLADSAVESVAVCLLFAYENPSHERRVRELLQDTPLDVPITLSSDVHPEIREFERTQTTALNAALAPVMATYLDALVAGLDGRSVSAPVRVVQSNGGLLPVEMARDRPVRTLLSGPAAGVRGASHAASRSGYEDVLTMDMGGTSCDVSFVAGGEPAVTNGVEVGDYAVGSPAVDVHTVGSGGGSIAWVDDGGELQVGPRSAGADPGPVCYGNGGTRPTTTDAQLLLGRIDPGALLPGEPADRDTVRESIEEHVGDPLGISPTAAAQGMLDVANATMERALRVVSIERGHDPRECSLVAFGGAGGLHAAELADALDVPRVLVPRAAGVLSAVGLLTSDVISENAVSRVRELSELDVETLEDTLAELAERGRADLDSAGIPAENRTLERSAELRYVGQTYSVRVPVSSLEAAGGLETLSERFHRAHERRYGHAEPGEPVELVTARVRARGELDAPQFDPPDRAARLEAARSGTRAVTATGATRDTPVYAFGRLPVGEPIDGPAVVETEASTVFVPPGQRGEIDEQGTLCVEVDP